jgi:signal transduction histidine kinase/ActR/RegA family two-component response regulator
MHVFPTPMFSNLDGQMVGLDHSQEIRAAQVRLLYEQLPSALLATIVNATILIAILWREVSQAALMGWWLVVLAVALGRYIHRRSYLGSPSENTDSLNWERRHIYSVAANGVLWGLAGYSFFTPHSYVHQVFLAFVLMGMASGSISTLSSSRGAYLVFLILALSPYGLQLVRAGDALHLAMAGMLVLYLTMMAMIGHRLHMTVTESLRLRFDNVDLLRNLTQAKDRQEAVNRELATQVAEKHSAQDALQKANTELERRVEERTAELTRSEEALRDAARRKDEFLAMLGHELRNPLAPIRNAIQVMHKPAASDSVVKRAHEIIDRQIDRLTRLVDDLLDVSRIVSGKISLQETMLEIDNVINRAVEGSLPFIEARNQNLVLHVPREPLWIKGDLVRLDQVISNLLNNAAKYSDIGARIRLDVLASDQWVTVRVQDNGSGITPEFLPHVFDLFAQANHSLARTQGGLGIGLTLVKRLVEMHGGRVEVHSEGSGRGSEFLVHLPRERKPAQMGLRTLSHNQVSGSEEPVRVLVVDDNHDAAESLAFLLSLEGYTVDVAYDGVTALSEAAKFHPQVVLLDIGMPGMDGYQVARELRAGESTRSMSIIALTGYGQPDDREHASAAGFDEHLTKPVDTELLVEIVRTKGTG